MTDANLVRHLQAQMVRKAGLVSFHAVRRGAGAVREEMQRLEEADVAVALVDALGDDDLRAIAEAVLDRPLVTGGSGLGGALADVWRRRGWLDEGAGADAEPDVRGRVLVLAGSCSEATAAPIERASRCGPGRREARRPPARRKGGGRGGAARGGGPCDAGRGGHGPRLQLSPCRGTGARASGRPPE